MAESDSNHKISTLEIAWAAGFLEGEGSFSCHHSPRVEAAQVQREPLERLLKLFGGNIRKRKARFKNQSDNWYWILNARRSPQVMMTIYTLMSPRRKQQIETSLLKWRNKKSYRHQSDIVCPNGHPMSGDNLIIRKRGGKECRACVNAQQRRAHSMRIVRRNQIKKCGDLIPV